MHNKSLRFGTFLQHFSKQWKSISLSMLGLALILAGLLFAFPHLQMTNGARAVTASAGDWPQYMYNDGRSGYNTAETIINKVSAPHLQVHWTFQGMGAIFSQPVQANGLIYWGSFDGNEHATTLNGAQVWQQNLGQTSQCLSKPLGVVSTAAVVPVSINGQMLSVVYVGGGNGNLYALNASTGAIIWNTPLGTPGSNTFIWDSPTVFNNNVYIGIASAGEGTCKTIPGAFFELNPASGSIEHTFSTAPGTCRGGGIWGSPTFDASAGSVYFTTGNQSPCTDPYAVALVKLRISDLAYESSWSVPSINRVKDGDFGSTPTLFTATIGGILLNLVGVANKNGIYYVFDRTAISQGPIWQAQIAVAGNCPECGNGSISPGVWDGSNMLYVAGGTTTIKGAQCRGSLRALNPANGSFLWEDCMMDGTVLGAVTLVQGVVAVVEGPVLLLVDASTGATLFTYKGTSKFYGSPSISNGVLYVGTKNGHLYAFGI